MADLQSAWSADNVTSLSPDHHRLQLRMIEALLFASVEPLSEEDLAARLPADADLPALVRELQTVYASRGVNLRQIDGRWAFRTAEDLAFLLSRDVVAPRKLSRAAMETLAIIAYHQPVTRADIEEIRGVAISKGTLDVLLEAGWVRLRGRRHTPGRPVTFGTTAEFLDHFGIGSVADLPGIGELKAAGLLDLATSSASDREPREDGREDGMETRENIDEDFSGAELSDDDFETEPRRSE